MKKSTMVSLAVVVGGVVAAGYLMNMGRNLPVIGDARTGYTGA